MTFGEDIKPKNITEIECPFTNEYFKAFNEYNKEINKELLLHIEATEELSKIKLY